MPARQCTRCLLDHTCVNIGFDRDGLCAFCQTYDRHRARLNDFERLQALLAERIEALRGRGEYDCLVGLSGGKDSSYVAYRLKQDFGLRILLVTFDNGFLSDYGRKNVRRMVDVLGMDHVFHTPDRDVQRALVRSSVRWFGVPCVSCAFPMMAYMIKTALEKRIPFIVHGRSRAQMFKELADGAFDPFLPFCLNGLVPHDAERNKREIRAAAKRLRRMFRVFLPDRALRRKAAESYEAPLDRFAGAAYFPESIAYFLSRPYDEKRFMATLERELGWERPTADEILGHQDCLAHPAATYLYTRSYGYPMIAQELSTMIREGNIDRAEAMERLRAERFVREYPASSMQALSRVSGRSEDFLVRNTARVARRLNLLKLALRARNRLLGRSPVLPPA